VSSHEDLKTKIGKQLYNYLPEVYRTRDQGDLARFLDACGGLLDRIRVTLDQRLADSFPDNPPSGNSCQPWLVPYFAQLLDVRLVSPDDRGRREEVANAVAWRQRKGTLHAIEHIAEAVAQIEVEVQEGWKRTAQTARIGMPRLPAAALGEKAAFDQYQNHPIWAARHPDLPTTTLDFRYPTRAVQIRTVAGAIPSNPASKQTDFAGQHVWWRQANPHGAPCSPGSYDDVSRRTVDLRTPDWRQGHIHPKRVILYAPPPLGFFPLGTRSLGDTVLVDGQKGPLTDQVIDGVLRVTGGTVRLVRCAVRRVEVTTRADASDTPIIVAHDSLFGEIAAPGLVQLQYCTVLGSLNCGRLQASDSIFNGAVTLATATKDRPHCIRFSCIPSGSLIPERLSNALDGPVFWSVEFGAPGCGVLCPSTTEAIRFGAEDGGEMGAYHHRCYCLLTKAVLDKLREFLPVGIEAVIVPDERLHRLPLPPCDENSNS
jgi:Phage tail protein (Tail_P2_I)